jgi:hypothetical protein
MSRKYPVKLDKFLFYLSIKHYRWLNPPADKNRPIFGRQDPIWLPGPQVPWGAPAPSPADGAIRLGIDQKKEIF